MKPRGFTLIELVIVIIVLGVLTATAVPKFINLQDDAEKATLRGFAAGFDGGLEIIASKHILEGEPLDMIISDTFLFFQSHISSEIRNNPFTHYAGGCALIWNAAVTGILASEDHNDDELFTTLEVNDPKNPNVSTTRCNYAYKNVGSVLYTFETNSICVQYTDEPEPEACKL